MNNTEEIMTGPPLDLAVASDADDGRGRGSGRGCRRGSRTLLRFADAVPVPVPVTVHGPRTRFLPRIAAPVN